MHGSLAVLAAAGWETAPCFAALCGSPAGRLSAACLREISGTLLDRVAAAMPFDVLILHLHGAAAADGEDDPEGYLLEKVRTDLGYRGRVVLSLDLHANFTRRMMQYADAVTAYRTFPHMDFTATGERAARLALHRGPFTRAAAKVSALMPPTDSTHFAGHCATCSPAPANWNGGTKTSSTSASCQCSLGWTSTNSAPPWSSPPPETASPQ